MVAAPEEGPEALLAHMVFDRAEVARRPRPARHVEAETGESAPGEPADFAASENADARRRRLPLLQFAPLAAGLLFRSEQRRVGKECVSTCRSRCSPYPSKKKELSIRSSPHSDPSHTVAPHSSYK